METEKEILVIATGNPGKIRDFAGILGETRFQYRSLKDIDFEEEPDENAETFEGNATIKARATARFLNRRGISAWVVADDSGIEVSTLNGAPGVHSARYAGTHGDDLANNALLLKNLGTSRERSARYVCALSLLHSSAPEAPPKIFEGECRGKIGLAPVGTLGFGYDPLFIPDGFSTTFAQMTIDEKKSLSHRGEAIKKLLLHFD